MTAKTAATTARPANPCCLVIFGVSGDLTHRLLMPALYNLAATGLLPAAFAIVGVARGDKSHDAFREDLAQGLRRFALGRIDPAIADRLLAHVAYVRGGADDPATYERLAHALVEIERDCGT